MKFPDWLPLPKSKDQRAIKAYNLGLKAKYRGDWAESLRQNKLANELRPGDEATLWNLAIAATALSDWEPARRAWRGTGIQPLNDGPGEVLAGCSDACVRVGSKGNAEVVWGKRIDPARMRILNVPLPSSQRRYNDIVINDGAEDGTRKRGDESVPVFNELGLWKMSQHSTYEVEVTLPDATAVEHLETKCSDSDIGVEDWGTMRILCEACSRGNPGDHECAAEPSGQNRFGFGATSENELRRVLQEWVEAVDGASVGEVRLVLSGDSA